MQINTERVRPFALGFGWALFGGALVRIYRLVRSHMDNPLFAPQSLLPALSLWIAISVMRVGRQKGPVTLKEAIALIRSGSLLMAIWGYRLYRGARGVPSPSASTAWPYLDGLYVLLGTLVMCAGLAVSRSIRGRK